MDEQGEHLGSRHAGKKEGVREREPQRGSLWNHLKGRRGQGSRKMQQTLQAGCYSASGSHSSCLSSHLMDGAFWLGTVKQPESPSIWVASWREPCLLSSWILTQQLCQSWAVPGLQRLRPLHPSLLSSLLGSLAYFDPRGQCGSMGH